MRLVRDSMLHLSLLEFGQGHLTEADPRRKVKDRIAPE